MIVLFLFLIIALILFLNSQNFFDAKDLLESATYITAGASLIIFIFLYIGDFKDIPSLYNLCFIPLFIFGIYYIKLKCKAKDLKVLANQQRYFNEIKASDVYRFYKNRLDIKKNRVESFVKRI